MSTGGLFPVGLFPVEYRQKVAFFLFFLLFFKNLGRNDFGTSIVNFPFQTLIHQTLKTAKARFCDRWVYSLRQKTVLFLFFFCFLDNLRKMILRRRSLISLFKVRKSFVVFEHRSSMYIAVRGCSAQTEDFLVRKIDLTLKAKSDN